MSEGKNNYPTDSYLFHLVLKTSFFSLKLKIDLSFQAADKLTKQLPVSGFRKLPPTGQFAITAFLNISDIFQYFVKISVCGKPRIVP